ncbi:MAG: radical SAM protein [Candidatus Eremiobacterota bacterium]
MIWIKVADAVLLHHEEVPLLRYRTEVFRIDEAGRLLSWAQNGWTFRRGLDGTVLALQGHQENGHRFQRVRRLEGAERCLALEEARLRLRQLGALTELDWEEDAALFRRLYGRVGILPPDRYRSLVLQLTRGCSYNRCGFCTFYRGEPHRVRSREPFRRHVEEVCSAFGPGLASLRGVFLGEGNAASLSTGTLMDALGVVREAGLGDVGAFLDTFTTARSASEWAELVSAGLRELYLGVESGSKLVLKLLRKPGSPGRVASLVGALKGAGLSVSVILLCGAGGHEHATRHLTESAGLLRRLPLGRGDRVYLSDLEVVPGTPYAGLGLTPMSRLKCREQGARLRELAGFEPPPRGPAVTWYDVRQFAY